MSASSQSGGGGSGAAALVVVGVIALALGGGAALSRLMGGISGGARRASSRAFGESGAVDQTGGTTDGSVTQTSDAEPMTGRVETFYPSTGIRRLSPIGTAEGAPTVTVDPPSSEPSRALVTSGSPALTSRTGGDTGIRPSVTTEEESVDTDRSVDPGLTTGGTGGGSASDPEQSGSDTGTVDEQEETGGSGGLLEN